MKLRAINLILVLMGLTVVPVSAIAQSTQFSTADSTTSATAENTIPSGYSRYTLSDRYTIDFPNGSYVYYNDDDYLIITNYLPEVGSGCCFETGDLKTNVYTLQESFETAVSNNAVDMSGFNGEFVRQELLTINGQPAARSWWTGGENGGDSVLTVIQISETETAFVDSFYGSGDTDMEAAIADIHNSFQAGNSGN